MNVRFERGLPTQLLHLLGTHHVHRYKAQPTELQVNQAVATPLHPLFPHHSFLVSILRSQAFKNALRPDLPH